MITLGQAKQHLTERQPFNAGNLTATIHGDFTDAPSAYVVYSYGVIIAWEISGDLFIAPSAYNHSVTTSKHANIVKRAWGLL